MDSPLFPFASCAFQAPCWAPNRRLLHSGPRPYSHPPNSSLPGPPSPPSNPQSTITQKGSGKGGGNHSPPYREGGGLQKALTLTSPHHELPSSLPLPKGARMCRDTRGGGLNRELGSGSRTPPLILPTPSPHERGPCSKPGPKTKNLSWRGRGLERRNTVPLRMEARPGMRLTLKSRSIRRIGGCGVYKNLGGLGLDERDDLLGEGQVLLG